MFSAATSRDAHRNRSARFGRRSRRTGLARHGWPSTRLTVRELHRFPQILDEPPLPVLSRFEIAPDHVRRQARQGTLAIKSRLRLRQHPRVDVRADDLDMVDIHQSASSRAARSQSNRAPRRSSRERTRSARDRPAPCPLTMSRQQGVAEAAQLVLLAVEIGFVDREAVDQLLDFASVRLQPAGNSRQRTASPIAAIRSATRLSI